MGGKVAKVADAIRRHDASGRSAATGISLHAAVTEFRELEAAVDAQVREMMAAHGITEEMLQALEASQREPLEQRLLREEIRTVSTTAWLDDAVPIALEKVLRSVPPRWLDQQATIGAVLDETYRTEPLCLAASRRLRPAGRPPAIRPLDPIGSRSRELSPRVRLLGRFDARPGACRFGGGD